MKDAILGAVLQVLLFSLIPFVVFLIQRKTFKGFLGYIGLKKSTLKANLLAIVACLLFAAPPLILTMTSNAFREIMFDPHSVTGGFRQMHFGVFPLIILLVMALIKTALAEELFFRGFVAKRLVSLLGYAKGNVIQAVIFGLLHTGLFLLVTKNPPFLTVIFLVPTIGAYVSVYLNEKLAHGSIIPGWISHGLANVLAYGIVGFVMP